MMGSASAMLDCSGFNSVESSLDFERIRGNFSYGAVFQGCSNACTAALGSGNSDLTGPGAQIAYIIQTVLSFVICPLGLAVYPYLRDPGKDAVRRVVATFAATNTFLVPPLAIACFHQLHTNNLALESFFMVFLSGFTMATVYQPHITLVVMFTVPYSFQRFFKSVLEDRGDRPRWARWKSFCWNYMGCIFGAMPFTSVMTHQNGKNRRTGVLATGLMVVGLGAVYWALVSLVVSSNWYSSGPLRLAFDRNCSTLRHQAFGENRFASIVGFSLVGCAFTVLVLLVWLRMRGLLPWINWVLTCFVITLLTVLLACSFSQIYDLLVMVSLAFHANSHQSPRGKSWTYGQILAVGVWIPTIYDVFWLTATLLYYGYFKSWEEIKTSFPQRKVSRNLCRLENGLEGLVMGSLNSAYLQLPDLEDGLNLVNIEHEYDKTSATSGRQSSGDEKPFLRRTKTL